MLEFECSKTRARRNCIFFVNFSHYSDRRIHSPGTRCQSFKILPPPLSQLLLSPLQTSKFSHFSMHILTSNNNVYICQKICSPVREFILKAKLLFLAKNGLPHPARKPPAHIKLTPLTIPCSTFIYSLLWHCFGKRFLVDAFV